METARKRSMCACLHVAEYKKRDKKTPNICNWKCDKQD